MLTGTIKEYPGLITKLKVHNDALYFLESDKLIRLYNESQDVFCEKKNLCGYNFTPDGLWIEYSIEGDDEQSVNEFIDVFNKNITHEKEDLSISSGLFRGDKCFCLYFESITYDTWFCAKDFKTGETKKVKTDVMAFDADHQHVFTRSLLGEVSCFNYELDVVWKKKFDNWVRLRGNIHPLLVENAVIINIGVDRKTEKQGKIVALSKENGDLIWQKQFEQEVSNCLLVNDKIYVAHNGWIIVLNPKDGSTLVNKFSGFGNRTHEDTLWWNQGYLFYISCGDAAVRVFSGDGKKVIQDIMIPRPFEPIVGNCLISYHDRYYLPLALSDPCLNGSVYGLLIIGNAEKGGEAEIAVEQRPDYEVLTRKTEGKQEYCRVVFKSGNLADVLKYGPIVMKEYANVKGAQIWSDERRNPKFNGKVLFDITLEAFNASEINQVTEMINETEKWFDTMAIRAGNRKAKIKIELRSSTHEFDEA